MREPHKKCCGFDFGPLYVLVSMFSLGLQWFCPGSSQTAHFENQCIDEMD